MQLRGMKMKGAGWLAAFIGFTAGVQAETVTLTATDTGSGDQSFSQAGHWSNGLAPTNGNDYVVALQWLRTPYSNGATFSFGGDSLTITNGGGMIIKAEGHSYVTIDDFRLVDGGLLRSGANPASSIWEQSGKITVIGSGEMLADQSALIIRSTIEGPGDLTLSGTLGTTLSGTNAMTGDIIVSAGTKTFDSTSVSFFTIGENGVNNAITGTGASFDGTFVFDLDAASTVVGHRWEVTTEGATFGSNFMVEGFLDNEDGSWYIDTGAARYKFYESSGLLLVVTANVIPVGYSEESPSGSGAHPNAIISAELYDGDPEIVDTDTVVLKLNGSEVEADVEIGFGTNIVSYAAPESYASGSTNAVELTFADSSGVLYTSSWSFIVSTYSEVSTDYAYDLSATNGASRGYWFRDVGWGVTPDPEINWDVFPGDALAALRYAGDFVASNDVSAVETNENYFLSENISAFNVINFSDKLSDNDGYFDSLNDWPEDAWPSISAGNFAAEILGYLELEPGIYTLGLDCDWGSVGLWFNDTPSDYFADTPWMSTADRGSDAVKTFEVLEAGLYPVRIVFNRRNDSGDSNNWGCAIELWTVLPDGTKVLVNDTANGGVPMWRADVDFHAYTKSVSPDPGSYIAPSQDISIALAGSYADYSVNMLLNGTPIGPNDGWGANFELGEDNELTGVIRIEDDDVLIVNQTNTLTLIYQDATTGVISTNSWIYDVANYVEFIAGTPTGTIFTNAQYIEASIESLTGTLKTDAVKMLLNGVEQPSLDITTGSTNFVGFLADLEQGTSYDVELVYEANEGGGLVTNAWSFDVHSTTTELLWNINIAGVADGNQQDVTNGVIAAAPSAGLNLWNNLAGVNNTNKNATNSFEVIDSSGLITIGFETYGAQVYGYADASVDKDLHQEMFQGWMGANVPMDMVGVISDLNPDNAYDIYLYGTWYWTENTVTYEITEGYGENLSGSLTEVRSAVTGASTTDYTGCQEGVNYVVLRGVTPTPDGRIVFNGACTDGVLSGLQILEHTGEGNLPDLEYLSTTPSGSVSGDSVGVSVSMLDIGVTVDPNAVVLLLDGGAVTPGSAVKSDGTTTVSYVATELSVGPHTAGIVPVEGAETNEWSFMVAPESGATVYVDAAPANTMAWNANAQAFAAYNPPVDGSYGQDNEWEIEPTGNNTTWYEADRDGPVENAPQLKTSVTGLSDSTYAVFAYGWTADESSAWKLAASLTPSYTNGLTIYDVSSAGVYYPAQTEFASGSVIVTESNRKLFAVYLGTVSGTSIDVYIDDDDGTDIGEGFWYDGIGYVDLNGAPPVESPIVSLLIPSGGPITLTWPVSAGDGFSTLTNADLSNADGWADAGLVPYVDGDNYVVTNLIGGESSLFFKLESN